MLSHPSVMAEALWDAPTSSIKELIQHVQDEHVLVPPLAHYTNLGAVIGILETKSIWLTLCDYMNDPLERRYGMRLLIEEVAQYDHSSLHIRGISDSLSHWLSSFVDDDGNYVFLVSFSEERDRLSQWRAYAEDGTGCAIVIDAAHVPDRHSPNGLLQLPVLYERSAQQTLVQRGIQVVFSDAESALDSGVDLTTVRNGAGRALHRWGIFCSLMLKQPAFAEEHEWRFIAITDMGPAALDICMFRRAGVGLAPYFAWDFAEKFSQIVTEVRLGPRAASASNERSLRWLLDKHGYHRSHVTRSDASYR
jgi:hypothetical protein